MLLPVADCPAPPPLAAPRADRPRYALTVRVDPGFRRVRGTVRVTFTASKPTRRLVFRLWPNGPLEREAGAHLDAGPVRSDDGRRLPVRRPDPTTLVVRLREALGRGDSVTVRMPWGLRVPFEATDRNSRFPGGLRLGSFFPILAWDPDRGWATEPPPLVPAESSTTPTADFDLRIRAPRALRVAVTGSRVGAGHWRAERVRDVGLAVGRFRFSTTVAHAPDPVTVRVAIAPGAAVGARVLETAKASLERLSRMYGPYPWPEYTLVFPPDAGEFGIEYPGLVYIGSRRTTLIIRHETAHQWFYSLVGNDQAADPWLDEALATWAEGRLAGSFARALNLRPQHVGAPMTYWGRRARAYYTEVYGGGVVALQSLGPAPRVDCALRSYVARNAYRIARPADLLDALSAVFPAAERRLRRFGIHR